MQRIFGVGKKRQQGPSMDDISQTMGSRAESTEKKVQKLEEELQKIKEQLKKTKSPAVQSRLKQKAAQLLKQRKIYQQHVDSLYNQQFNLDQTTFVTNNLKDNLDTVNAMKQASKEMKKQYKKFDIDKLERLQDDMFDLMEDANEIQEIMSRSYETPDIDEEDIMDELDALESDMTLQEENADYLDVDLTPPQQNVSVPSTNHPSSNSEEKDLEKQLGLV